MTKPASFEHRGLCAQVMGMGDISKVDTWRKPDGVRVDKLIMRPSQDKCARGCIVRRIHKQNV